MNNLIVFGVLLILGGCGIKYDSSGIEIPSSAAANFPTGSSANTNTNTSSPTSSGGSNNTPATSGCSADGSHALVPGAYIFQLSSAVSSKQKTQVKIFKSDCTYCFETVTEGESTDLTSDGSWTSELGTNDENGQEINITVGTVTYTLSGDGLTLSQSSSVWGKTLSDYYTCN